ncbi:MAG: hypothetical protein ACK55I_41550, partial [bacterium]
HIHIIPTTFLGREATELAVSGRSRRFSSFDKCTPSPVSRALSAVVLKECGGESERERDCVSARACERERLHAGSQ